MLNADILINVKFYDEKSGRKSPTPPNFFACLLEVDGKKYDARLILEKTGFIKPGEFKTEIPVKFLNSKLAMPSLRVGKKIYLWELGNIAEGIVTKIINGN